MMGVVLDVIFLDTSVAGSDPGKYLLANHIYFVRYMKAL